MGGGNAPIVVFDDADLDLAVLQAVASKFRSLGQTRIIANRIYVQSGIYDKFADQFAEKSNCSRSAMVLKKVSPMLVLSMNHSLKS